MSTVLRFIALVAFGWTLLSIAEEKPAPSVPKTTPAKPDKLALAKIKYQPPLRGALSSEQPHRRRGGARGDGVSLITLEVLAPDHTGWTGQPQPTLYWFQSAPADVPFEFSVIREGDPKPLVLVRLPDARAAGLQRLRLADHGVKLEPGVEYEWVVALVVNPESRSRDVIASGYIQYDPASTARTDAAESAAAGLWYDALSQIIDAQSDELVTLLAQVGLTNVTATTLPR